MAQLIDFSKYRKFHAREDLRSLTVRTAQLRGSRCAKSDHSLGYRYQPEAWGWYGEFDPPRRQAFLIGYGLMWQQLEKEKQA